jgi:hypothetical protein
MLLRVLRNNLQQFHNIVGKEPHAADWSGTGDQHTADAMLICGTVYHLCQKRQIHGTYELLNPSGIKFCVSIRLGFSLSLQDSVSSCSFWKHTSMQRDLSAASIVQNPRFIESLMLQGTVIRTMGSQQFFSLTLRHLWNLAALVGHWPCR